MLTTSLRRQNKSIIIYNEILLYLSKICLKREKLFQKILCMIEMSKHHKFDDNFDLKLMKDLLSFQNSIMLVGD